MDHAYNPTTVDHLHIYRTTGKRRSRHPFAKCEAGLFDPDFIPQSGIHKGRQQTAAAFDKKRLHRQNIQVVQHLTQHFVPVIHAYTSHSRSPFIFRRARSNVHINPCRHSAVKKFQSGPEPSGAVEYQTKRRPPRPITHLQRRVVLACRLRTYQNSLMHGTLPMHQHACVVGRKDARRRGCVRTQAVDKARRPTPPTSR